MRSRPMLLALVAMAAVPSAHATILTFSGLGLSDGATLPQGYGDNISSTGANGSGTYQIGNGWTPNVSASYYSTESDGTLFDPNVYIWASNFGDLNNVIYGADGKYLRLRLAPDAGYSVKLNSFWLAGYPNTDRVADRIRVLDDSGGVLWTSSSLNVKGATGHSVFSPNVTSSGALTIEVGNSFYIGLDQINFSQAAAVPEPTTLAVFAIGGLALLRRRRR